MELPDDVVEAIVAPEAPVAPEVTIATAIPARNTRSSQRRRAATVAADAPPVAEAAAPVAEAAAVVTPVLPEPVASLGAAPVEPVSFNPPAAVMADIATEDHVMDNFTTADTIAETANDTAEQMAGRGQAVFADLNGRAKAAMEKTGHMVEELGSFGKGNMEALVESSKIAAKGLETLGQEAAEFTKRSFESATAAMKTLAATRSPTEFMKLQSDYARSMFDTMMAETSKSTEMMMKLANDVAQPISNRVAIAAEKIKVAA